MYITLPYDTIKTTDLFFQYSCTDQQGRGSRGPSPPPPFECVLFANQNHYFLKIGYSNNYVFDFSNVVLQSLINVRSFKMYMYFLYKLYGYRRINELNCNLIDRLI